MKIVSNKALVLRTRQPTRITDRIKRSKVVAVDGDIHDVAVYWDLEEARQLAAMRVKDVPSPIKRDYTWTGKFKPYAHQRDTASFLTLHDKAFCFSEAGTGKTASVIWAADYLMKLGDVKRVLVVCPLSIMKAAWQTDLFRFAMHRSCGIAYGTRSVREKVVKGDYEFVIINFDGIAVMEKEIEQSKFDLIVVDEANAFKNVQTNRWKVFNRLAAKVKKLWMLTGTPAAQSPLDAYGLAKLVNPENVPKFYGAFRDRVMYKVSQFKWAPKPHAKDVVHAILQPAIRFEKRQCLDLPPVTAVQREVPMTPQQLKYYKALKKQMAIEAAGEDITSVNAATNLNKLLQISGGAVYSDEGAVVEFDVSNRLAAVLEVIEETSNKVLIFVPFTHTIELLKEYLIKEGVTCEVLNGQVSANRRGDIVKTFQEQPNPRVLIIQPQAASHGLTLTAADTIIWYAPVPSVETYLQANARIDRPGQVNPMTIIHIQGSDTEAHVYKMLQGKVKDHVKLIDLYKQTLEGTT